MAKVNKKYSMIVRNFTFGVEDSLVSTVGLLTGIAVAGISRKEIILTGTVLIFVEAFSMAVGSLLSEQSVEQYEENQEAAWLKPAIASVVMFFSYLISGLIPLSPYAFSVSKTAILCSVVLTFVSLFLLGAFNARMFGVRIWRAGLTTLIMGGLAIAVGILVGQAVGNIGF